MDAKVQQMTPQMQFDRRAAAMAPELLDVSLGTNGMSGTNHRRPSPLSYEEVAQAADAIAAIGEKVTIGRLRQQVGGAAETVTKFYNQWMELRRSGQAIAHDPVPQNIRAALLQAFAAQREDAESAMQQRLEEQRESVMELDAALQEARCTIEGHEEKAKTHAVALANAKRDLDAALWRDRALRGDPQRRPPGAQAYATP